MNAPPPRQSLFPGAAPNFSQGPISTSHLSSLSTSLQSLRQSVDVLHHTNGLLQRSVADVPRLTTVLTAKRHYDVVTEGKVMQAKKQLEEEVRPHINELIRRAEEMVGAEEAAAKRARNKVSTLTTRLQQALASQSIKLPPTSSSSSTSALLSGTTPLTQGEEEEVILLEQEQRQAADLTRVRRRRLQLEGELRELELEVQRTEMEVTVAQGVK